MSQFHIERDCSNRHKMILEKHRTRIEISIYSQTGFLWILRHRYHLTVGTA